MGLMAVGLGEVWLAVGVVDDGWGAALSLLPDNSPPDNCLPSLTVVAPTLPLPLSPLVLLCPLVAR